MPTINPFLKKDDLSDVLANSYNHSDIINLKQNTKYIYTYLRENLSAKSMLVEEDYFSQSYFDDYKFFHINSYSDHSKVCKRIHFFSELPPKLDSNNIFDFNTDKKEVLDFWKSYLGYIVVRPLPNGIIGATLLRYPNDKNNNYRICIPVKIKNSINIYGFQIENFETLIYQEQDRIVGACATASLWSALDKASELYGSSNYSPSKLTDMAGKHFENGIPQRKYPNKNGLNLLQITHVLDSLGLDYEINIYEKRRKIIPNEFKDFILAYLRNGIPLLLGVEFKDFALHSLTIVGYKEYSDNVLLNNIATTHNKEEPIYKAHYIDCLYAHDDQLGPFSNIGIDSDGTIKINWEGEESVKLYSILSIVHPTWVVGANTVKKQISLLDALFKELEYLEFCDSLFFYWDYYIVKSNQWKSECRVIQIVHNNDIIYKSLPQFVWAIDLFREDNRKSTKVLTFLIDITSLSDSFNIIKTIIYDSISKDFIEKSKENIQILLDKQKSLISQTEIIDETVPLARRKIYFLNHLLETINEMTESSSFTS